MKRSKVEQLPPATRDELNKKLVEKGFANYDVLETWLKGLGISISKSAIHRYGQALERRLQAIKTSTEAAKLIAAETQDDADDRSAAVMSMIQTEVFEVLVDLKDLEAEDNPLKRAEILSKLSKNWATLTRASVALKRYQTEVRTKAQAVADKLSAAAKKKGGLTAGTVEAIRREILGLAPQ